MKIPKDLIKEYVKSEKFTSTADIMESIKSMFADVLNEVLQRELDEQLGYDKHVRTESGEKNYRNGSTKRKMKTQLDEVEISVPRDRNGEYEPKIIGKYQRNADGLKDKMMIFMDAIHYKIRENHQIISRAAYVVLGVNADGYKDILVSFFSISFVLL